MLRCSINAAYVIHTYTHSTILPTVLLCNPFLLLHDFDFDVAKVSMCVCVSNAMRKKNFNWIKGTIKIGSHWKHHSRCHMCIIFILFTILQKYRSNFPNVSPPFFCRNWPNGFVHCSFVITSKHFLSIYPLATRNIRKYWAVVFLSHKINYTDTLLLHLRMFKIHCIVNV